MIGQSNITPWKELCFQEILTSFMEMAKWSIRTAKRNMRKSLFHVFDLYAGIGVNDYGEASTRIFYNKLNCVGGLDNSMFSLVAVDKDKCNCDRLRLNLADIADNITIMNSSASDIIMSIPRNIRDIYGEKPCNAFGVVFLDPNGVVKKEEYNALVQLSMECPRIGIVANMSVTQLHRNRGVKKIKGFGIYNQIGRLSKWQRDFNKKHLYVREILQGGRHKWTIAALTNDPLYGINKKLSDCGFYNANSERGTQILSEIDNRQATIFEALL